MKSGYLRKRLIAIVAACAMVAPCLSTGMAAADVSDTGYGLLIYDDFENGEIGNYIPRGEETVEISSEESYSGKYSLKVFDRTQTWNGPMCEKTEELTLGETYSFSVAIKYTDSYTQSKNFSLQLQYSDGVEDIYKNIKTSSVNKGQWTVMKGEYTIPTDAQNVYLYVETEYKSSPAQDDLMDFYIDDFTATPASLPEIQKDIAGLKDVFSNYFTVGGAATANELAPKPGRDLFTKHYSILTPGNELKPDSVLDYNATIAFMEENDGNEVNPQISLRAAKTILEFAEANHIPVRGHTLVWHSQTPDWFFKVGYSKDSNAAWASKEVMLERMENYIKNVMEALATQYPNVEFYAWDVVNEAIDPNTSTGYRNPGSNNVTSGNSAWMQTVGPEFIEKAFEYARKYAPEGCKLFYNDYNEYESAKMNYIYNMLKDLKEKGLVDGMGMQSHWVMQYPSVSMFETAVKKYDSLGLEIQLTEIDMKNPDNSTYALTQQATRYKEWMNKAVELKKAGCNISAIIFWGMTDTNSWIGGYPLLFDGNYQAKAAYYSIVEDYKNDVKVTPTVKPTTAPTVKPTVKPTAKPTATPTVKPTATPTVKPTVKPTAIPTVKPTTAPTVKPSTMPTVKPTATPTVKPTVAPTTTPVNPTDMVVTAKKSIQLNYNTIYGRYQISANKDMDLSKLTIVLKANNLPDATQILYCDHAALQMHTAPWYTAVTGNVRGTVSNGSATVTFAKSQILPAGSGYLTIDTRIAKKDWTSYDELSNPIVEIYYDGVKVSE